MTDIQPISPRIILVDPRSGHLTSEGFRFLQAMRATVVGEDDGGIGVEDLQNLAFGLSNRPDRGDEEVRELASMGLLQRSQAPQDDTGLFYAHSLIGRLAALQKEIGEFIAGGGYYAPGGTDVAVTDGGTGASTAAGARTDLEIITGTWTPTLTNGLNLDASTAQLCHYTRIGNHVHCFGSVAFDPTAAGSSTTLFMSLPVASNFAATTDARGTFATSSASRGGVITADVVNDRLQFTITPEVAINTAFSFTFGYEII